MPKPSPEPLSDVTREFGRRVQQRRTELGLTQEVAAERIGVHWTYLGQVERGRRNVSLHNIVRIAQGLEIDAGELVRDL
ncbi:helix-turn-helix domain-containing protein [Tsukamurella tyrosinosolvens]|uniref:helix-turn-helix domain-containing protein n=1 Tax=Tsukamurella tyrosinosolvens TaxID=57704 RepID=UPI000DF70A25|nr:helix-turn-helix transcriptional regulator [Tsukamurella tyrosinosolvens]RDB47057.1 XRE family transcriptional regulator [Tsukamurella tyrosinosolvens]